MIQNTVITEKLKAKTEGNQELYEFMENLLEVEIQGKNYKKFYDTEINKVLEKRGKK